MKRRATFLLAVTAAVTMAVGGCGIPDETPVLTVEAGPTPGPGTGDAAAPPRNNRQDTSDRATFVKYFLEAAAGDPDGAVDRVKQFLSPTAQTSFKPSASVTVIRLTEEPLVNQGSDEITFGAQEIGQLAHNGILSPTTDDTVKHYSLTVKEVSGENGLFVTKTPQVMLISDTALQQFYERRTIYFWNTEHTALVPDVRYLALSVPPEQRPTVVLNWLVEGPAAWLQDVAEELPDGTTLIGNVPAVDNGRLQINLSDQAVPANDRAALDRLRRQLMWSLRPDLPRTLELKVGHQAGGSWSSADYLASNASYRLSSDPERFVLYAGKINRLALSADAGQPVPVLESDANKNVAAAAFAGSENRTYAAVVTGSGGSQQLRVAGARAGEQAELQRVTMPAGSIGQPVWAVTPEEGPEGAVGLVTVGGRIYGFTARGGAAHLVEWPGPGGSVTAVAVAPDARRVAMIVSGHLYVTTLLTGADTPQLGTQPVRVPTPPMPTITALDWSSEGWVVVAGTRADNKRVAVMDTTVDGAQQSMRLPDLGSEAISYLSAYPASPTGPETSGSVAYVAGSRAYDVLADPSHIGVDDLAKPVSDPPSGVQPTKPFFLR
ncbi:LpqB family beta-propeller domain-containing protein [Mangrovihabitans endophyticus]|uniref:Sporulation and spore germination n=1 Tax=Mangrovihabitans endophyticus TaxID=1751298 RepID=A0A8J3FP16_9ACTN|nr:LpqB family beta-propeller domain-containing protein [Mangrovihabitans endophyticus]GGK86118.1 hypothetical protein GCM10012284_20500 [Mangrovihabitans endophyticus]